MKKLLLFLFIVFGFFIGNTQSVIRQEIKGFILSSTNDVEAITIYNTSANKGTITDQNGTFTIAAAANDILEISALQFETLTISISKEVIDTKTLKVFLTEEVNVLDAVLLRSGLSGSLYLDISESKRPMNIGIDLGNMDAMALYDDKAFDKSVVSNELKRLTSKGELYNGINFIGIIGLLTKSKKKKKNSNNTDIQHRKQKTLVDIYTHKYISETYNIPENQVEAFFAFIENDSFPTELYDNKNTFLRMEYLFKQSKRFLKLEDVKK
ncbi:MAG: carboxypeptidase-like regulatory domain-containing protein [Aestuariibaculum sp.]